jgi:chromosome partitioning protein
MRRIAVINQKGGVGKTTTCANLGAALALAGRRVVLVDMDAQANLTLSLNAEAAPGSPSTYTVLLGESTFGDALRETSTPQLFLVPANIDLSGAELEIAAAMGREHLMREAIGEWERAARAKNGGLAPADYVFFDCPPSLGLLSINALAAADEVLIAIQTEFLALQGMSKLVEILQLLRKRLNPKLEIAGILPCLYDSRLKLAREVLAEIRKFFPSQVLPCPVRSNVKLAEAPSFGKTIFEYAPDSNGAQDYLAVSREIARGESRDPDLSRLAPIEDPSSRSEAPPASPVPIVPDVPGAPDALVLSRPPDAALLPGAPRGANVVAPNAQGDHVVTPDASSTATPRSIEAPSGPPLLATVVLIPALRHSGGAVATRTVTGAVDLPSLPPDAFEILESYVQPQ